jgi:hypothetical protein
MVVPASLRRGVWAASGRADPGRDDAVPGLAARPPLRRGLAELRLREQPHALRQVERARLARDLEGEHGCLRA